MSESTGVPVAWVAALLAGVVAGYPLVWAFFNKLVSDLLVRQNKVVDAWQETAIAREDKHRDELVSIMADADRRDRRAEEMQHELARIHRRLDELTGTDASTHDDGG